MITFPRGVRSWSGSRVALTERNFSRARARGKVREAIHR